MSQLLTIESNIEEQVLTVDAGGCNSIELVTQTPEKATLEVNQYPANITVQVNGVTQAEIDLVDETLQNHITNKTNPHQVEAKQIDNSIDFTLLFDNALI